MLSQNAITSITDLSPNSINQLENITNHDEIICPISGNEIQDPVIINHPNMEGYVYDRDSLNPYLEKLAKLGITEDHILSDTFTANYLQRLRSSDDNYITLERDQYENTIINEDALINSARDLANENHLLSIRLRKAYQLAQRTNKMAMTLEIFSENDETKTIIHHEPPAKLNWLELSLVSVSALVSGGFITFNEDSLAVQMKVYIDFLPDNEYVAALGLEGGLIMAANFGALLAAYAAIKYMRFDPFGTLQNKLRDNPLACTKLMIQSLTLAAVLAKTIDNFIVTKEFVTDIANNAAIPDWQQNYLLSIPFVDGFLSALKNTFAIQGVRLMPWPQLQAFFREILDTRQLSQNPRNNARVLGESVIKASVYAAVMGLSLHFGWKMYQNELADDDDKADPMDPLNARLKRYTLADYLSSLPVVVITADHTARQFNRLLFFRPKPIDEKASLTAAYIDYFRRNADLILRMMLAVTAIGLIYQCESLPYIEDENNWEAVLYYMSGASLLDYVCEQGLLNFQHQLPKIIAENERQVANDNTLTPVANERTAFARR